MKPNKMSLLVPAILLFSMACLCTNTSAIPTTQPVQPAQPTEAAAPPVVEQPSSSGIITQVVMASDTQGEEKDPVDPTTVFGPSATIHAVAQIKDAPAGTQFTADFYVVDVGSAAAPNTLIGSTDVTADGTRNIDFTMSPTASWPAGSYRVDISVNGQLDQSVTFTVQ